MDEYASILITGCVEETLLKTAADITKARNLLNYNPQISFEHGIKNFIDWYNKN